MEANLVPQFARRELPRWIELSAATEAVWWKKIRARRWHVWRREGGWRDVLVAAAAVIDMEKKREKQGEERSGMYL